jgi:hypothetical protein
LLLEQGFVAMALYRSKFEKQEDSFADGNSSLLGNPTQQSSCLLESICILATKTEKGKEKHAGDC